MALGLEVVTGDDWAVLAGSRSRLSAFARPWTVPEPLADAATAGRPGAAGGPARDLAHRAGSDLARSPGHHGHPQRHARQLQRRRPLHRGGCGPRACRRAGGGRARRSWTSAANRPGPGATSRCRSRRSCVGWCRWSKRLARARPELVISVDTVKAEVARAGTGSRRRDRERRDRLPARSSHGPRGRGARTPAWCSCTREVPSSRSPPTRTPSTADGVVGTVLDELRAAVGEQRRRPASPPKPSRSTPASASPRPSSKVSLLFDQLSALQALGTTGACRSVAQAIPRSGDRTAGGGSGPRDGDRLRAGLGTRRPDLPGARRRRRPGSARARLCRSDGSLAVADEPIGAPPYRAAVAVALVVLAVYVLTLAPTVTFWDAGEFIAAAVYPRHPAPAGHAAVRADRPCLGPAAPHRGVRLPHQPAERALQRVRGRHLLPGRARSRCADWGARRTPADRCVSAQRRPRSSARSPSPTGRTRTRPRSTRSPPSRSPPCAGR